MAHLRATLAVLCVLLAQSSTALRAQDPSGILVMFRVTAERPNGELIIDRGSSDRLEVGDRVLVLPRSRQRLRGKIQSVDARSAVVALDQRTARAAPGTRGEAWLPKERFRRQKKPAPRKPEAKKAKPDAERAKEAEDPDQLPRPRWTNRDENWRPGMPLLSGVRPVRPENRAWRASGRAYTTGLASYAAADGTRNSYLRTGADMLYENLFGAGGELRFDSEFNAKTEQNNIRGADILIRRLGYTYGGSRFAENRIDGGRFLHAEVPEFGVMDGVAWSRRLENGHRVGASLGFLPEPDDDFESFQDLSVAGFYRWTSGELEELSITGGYQKTFHSGKSDRDLLIGKFAYTPREGWNLFGTTWIDLYTGNDSAKSEDLEVTQAVVNAARFYDDGSGIDVSFWHQIFPALLRRENRFIAADRLDRDRHDRLTLSAWMPSGSTMLRAVVGIWNDEDESGGSLELSAERPEVFWEDGTTAITLAGGDAAYETFASARLRTGRRTARGRWELSYDFTYHHQVGFPSDFNDIFQHRVFGEHNFDLEGPWDLSSWVDANLWDSDFSIALGFYLQRRF